MNTCSIVIRTKGAEQIERIIAAIGRQDIQSIVVTEIVIVDGDKMDSSWFNRLDSSISSVRAVLMRYEGESYAYGAALNQAIRRTTGEFVVSLSGHSVPTSERWLEALLEDLMGSEAVAGTSGGQTPEFPVNLLERFYRYTFYECAHTAHLLRAFNMTNAAIRRSAWVQWPFDEDIAACEDKLWAMWQRRNGFAVTNRPNAMVFHAHYKSFFSTLVEILWLWMNVARAVYRLVRLRPHK